MSNTRIEEREFRRASSLPPAEDVASRLEILEALVRGAEGRSKRLASELEEAKTLIAALRADVAKPKPPPGVRPLGRGLHAGKPMYSLALLRKIAKRSSSKVAKVMRVDRGELARLETEAALDDAAVSDLRRYARAIGGELRVAIELDGQRYTLHLTEARRR